MWNLTFLESFFIFTAWAAILYSFALLKRTESTFRVLLTSHTDKAINSRPVFPVSLFLEIRSKEKQVIEDITLGRVYDLTFSKDTNLPIPPFIGMRIGGLWSPIPINKVLVTENGEVRCWLKKIEATVKGIEDEDLFEKWLKADSWHEEDYSHRPEKD